jgi:NAD(P)-dependent dehydrogenase (short-subunit alcohol dehydrogenase family)
MGLSSGSQLHRLDLSSTAKQPGPGGIERLTEEAYEAAMAVHLKASVFGAKSVIPEMEKAGGGSFSLSVLFPD